MISPFRKVRLHSFAVHTVLVAIEVILVPRPTFYTLTSEIPVLNQEESDFLLQAVKVLLSDYEKDLELRCVDGKIVIGLLGVPKTSPALTLSPHTKE